MSEHSNRDGCLFDAMSAATTLKLPELEEASMMWLSRLAILVLGVIVSCETASAAPLAPGALLFPLPGEQFPSPIQGVKLAEQTVPFISQTYSGTLRSFVIQGDPTNPFPGGLTFLYQLHNQVGTHSINRLSVNGFNGFLLDVSFDTSEPIIGPGQPAYADRQTDGSAIGFSFDALGGSMGALPPGHLSRLLVVKTNATSFVQSSAFTLNGFPADIAAFAPVPEPSAIALAIAGVAMVLSWRRFRRLASTRVAITARLASDAAVG